MLGTLQGSYSKEHLGCYFDEYTFRFNRRKSNGRGLLFYRLLENAARLEPIAYDMIVSLWPILRKVNTHVLIYFLGDDA
jgi:hypothetical protein